MTEPNRACGSTIPDTLHWSEKESRDRVQPLDAFLSQGIDDTISCYQLVDNSDDW